MAKKEEVIDIKQKKILYSAEQTPPMSTLIFSSLQHMLLVLSLGMALPVTVARVANLDVSLSGSYLAAALFGMGFTSILQTLPGKRFGTGYQSFSCCDSAAISACVLAAETGGIPLVLGMVIFSSVVRFILGSFASKLKKLFPPEVTGTLIFILGINLVPTGFKNFLGSVGASGTYNVMHIVVAGATLLFMLACAIFIKPLQPYTALMGIIVGYILAIVTGVFDVSSLNVLSDKSVFALPFYSDLSFSFDVKMIVPFLIIAVAAVVDNIGDFTATQTANDPTNRKPNWKSIESGIRAGSLGTAISALFGGSAQATATTNIGIAGASGITSRAIAYVGGAMLMVVAFLPRVTGLLSMIPEPVLGAVLLYSMCYLMSGGFNTLATREMDTKRIFTIFLSIGAAVSTLIPNLYDFLPKNVSDIFVSPMIMGVCVLLITTLFGRIGSKSKYIINTGVSAQQVQELDKEILSVCKTWCLDHSLCQKILLSLDGICEGLYEEYKDGKLNIEMSYDGLQLNLKLHSDTNNSINYNEDNLSSLSIAIKMLPNMYDSHTIENDNNELSIKLVSDII